MLRARARLTPLAILLVASASMVGVAGARAADPCAPPVTNPIPCENSQPGTDPLTWRVTGAGDPGIQGFATDISVDVGSTVSFKINTGSTNYSLTIYRLGYYQGNGARQVAVVQPSAPLPQQQPACLTDPSSGLVDCGNWAVSASWTVPATAVSGVYFARVADNGTGAASQIWFVVRSDASTSAVLFRTNDTTWEAYNDYGGNNLYYGTGPSSNGRAFKVSFNRPFNDRGQGSGFGTSNFVLYAEYPMIRWLEANGYDVSYTTSIDAERSPALLKNHHVLTAAGHDEYWSAGERAAVQAARDAGVNLAFFTGNEDYWKVRWESSIDGSSTPFRTLVTYKETLENRVIDPQDPPTWTGTWRDGRWSPPADGGLPENALGGTLFTVNRGSAAPVIGSDFSRLRLWRNTAVAGLAAGQTVTLGSNTIGYEWDEDVDNGSRPAGLLDLSATTVSVPLHIKDYGKTFGPATAVHSMTMYRAASGALVFSAGTVQWAWGLDVFHDTAPDTGPSTPDRNMQQATLNVLADMGVQPATIQAGLVASPASTDTTPPTSTITGPAAGTSFVSGTPVTVTGTAADADGAVAGVEVSVDGGTTWHKATGTGSWSYAWTPGTPGPATIRSRAVDDSARLEAPSAGVAVTVTPRACPCTLFPDSAVPGTPNTQDSNAIEVGVKFTSDVAGTVTGVRFYKGSGNTGTHVGNLWSASGALLATATFSGESASGWQTVSFPTPVAIQANTTYVASYHTNIGSYSSDTGFFTRQLDAWPLHAPAGLDAVFAYGGTQFPSQSFNATNYWTDVVLSLPQSATTLSASPSTSSYGRSVTFTATVAAVPPAGGTPSGTVVFMDGPTRLGTGALAGGRATLATSGLGVGSHSVTAVYAGDATFAGSASAAVTETVQRAATALAAAPVVQSLLTLSATLTRSDDGTPLAGQTIAFSASGTSICSATTNAGGVASCSGVGALIPIVLNAGYTASFAGTTSYGPSSAFGGLIT